MDGQGQDTKLWERVHRAKTREEREAVYRFRYQVYHEEFGRELGSPDHERRRVTDAEDEKETSTILYTGSLEEITGTMRLRHWRAGEVPHHEIEELSMDRVPGIEGLNAGELGRFMIRPSERGTAVLADLVRASYEIFAAEKRTDVVFLYCSPGLLSLYGRIGMVPFGGRIVHAPDGMMLPLMAVISDVEHFRLCGSFITADAERHFGPNGRQGIDPTAIRRLYEPGTTGIECDGRRVAEEVAGTLLAETGPRSPFLDSLPRATLRCLLPQCQIVDVEEGTLVTRKGYVEKELYVVLDGLFEADDDGRTVACLERGALFGEDAFAFGDGRRRASVHALSPGRLLVVPGKAVERLAESKRELVTPLFDHVSVLAAHRHELPKAA